MIPGIDVSNRQGVIDWPQVAASGIRFALIKASEGATYQDPYAAANVAGALAAGVAPGLYHFALYATSTPDADAANFLSVARPLLQPGMPVAQDGEEDPYGNAMPANCAPWAESWNATVQAAVGALPLLYTNLDMIRNHGLGTPALADSGLWLASPGTAQPPAPAPWTLTALWQHSWTGSVPGVQGACDLNFFLGTVEQFRLYGVPAQPAPGKPQMSEHDRYQLVSYVVNGSGPSDIAQWVAQFRD